MGQSTIPHENTMSMEELEVRRLVKQIMNDSSIPEMEKSKYIQSILHSPALLQKGSQKVKPVAEKVVEEKMPEKTYHDEENQVLGCKHYMRGAFIKSPCCKQWVNCRFCHDEKEDHEMDRYAVAEMCCMECNTVQPIQGVCQSCGNISGNYYCPTCKFLDNNVDRSIYHCEKCGLCRVGPESNYFHCDKCNACMEVSRRDNHRCLEQILERDCCVCNDYLFTSTENVTFMKCGHAIHLDCFSSMLKYSYQCPICKKSVADMTEFFKRIDEALAQQTIPEEFRHRMEEIFCNDCEKKATVGFNFIYHKCPHCGSYSTTVLEAIDPGAENSIGEQLGNSNSNGADDADTGNSNSA